MSGYNKTMGKVNLDNMKKSVLSFIIIFLLSGCLPRQVEYPPRQWALGDLRILSPANASQPEYDVIAAYTRKSGTDLQIRLDLLDLTVEPTFDLYVAINSMAGGTTSLPINALTNIAWDMLVTMPVDADPRVLINEKGKFIPFPSIIPRIVRNPREDTIEISLNAMQLKGVEMGFTFQVFITQPGSPLVIDSIGPVRSDSLPPQQAQVALAFWNTFPAYTPAQALRRWEGSHTGPFGGRHGLHVLLLAVKHHQVPVILLDIKNPFSLSALDYIGAETLIQELSDEKLLILPDALPGSPSFPVSIATLNESGLQKVITINQKVARNFHLPASNILYSPYLPVLSISGYPIIITSLNQDRVVRWDKRVVIPLPISDRHEATSEGLSLELRMALLEATQDGSDSQNKLIVLGGDLSESTWGVPQAVEATMQYLASHPWIHILDEHDLLSLASRVTFRPQEGIILLPIPLQPNGLSDFSISELLCEDSGSEVISNCIDPSNPITEAIWQAFLALLAPLPPEPSTLLNLRANYISQILELAEAARWSATPRYINQCAIDLNKDGARECILATDNYFALIDSVGGRMALLFFRSPKAIHQVIAPSSQLVVGLSDASTWNLSDGVYADPGSIPGAFLDKQYNHDVFSVAQSPNQISFTSPNGELIKTFRFVDNRLQVDFTSSQPVTVQIPLVPDPWSRFSPGWADYYQEFDNPQGWSWSFYPDWQVNISTTAPIAAHLFTASRAMTRIAEDPNYAYPRGHYLPFPIGLIEITGEGRFTIALSVQSE